MALKTHKNKIFQPRFLKPDFLFVTDLRHNPENEHEEEIQTAELK